MFSEFSNRFENILVTGGYGFIGSCLIRNLLLKTKCKICNIDKINYASNLESISSIFKDNQRIDNKRYYFEKIDLNESKKLDDIFQRFKPDLVFHLAAETHVDRSITNPKVFIDNNIKATFNLLDSAKNYWSNKINKNRDSFLFIHISTDEVYGSLDKEGFFNENSPYKPNSPYSASKASSDHLVRAWHSTYSFPSIITNCSNNYGPWQFPDKLIPVIINKALNKEKIPIYGKGENIRDWLFVEDHIRALILIALNGNVGGNYCIGSGQEKTNLEIAMDICQILDKYYPHNKPHKQLIDFTVDRLGHDYRYSIDSTFINNEIGWRPKFNFEEGLKSTVDWYINNKNMQTKE